MEALAHQTTQNGTLTTNDKWSSQRWKSGERLGARTERPVDDKFVIDDDMDSDTATESKLSLRSRSFLHRVNDRLRKVLDHSSKDAMQDIDKRFLIWRKFMSSTFQASVFMRKNYSENLHSIKKYREQSHLKADVRHIWKVDCGTLSWVFWSVSNQLGKFSMETVILSQWWRSHQSLTCKGLCVLRFCVMYWKRESEPTINYCLGRKVDLVQEFTIQNLGHNWRGTDGIRVKYFPRIHHIAARRQSPRVPVKNERKARRIQRTNYLHDDVEWHYMEIYRQWTGMHC